ncbi:MAG: glycerol-3-phosphate dehydrogenase [Oceanotoga sp.]|uniref:Glycerol-3-phosphate dehydrogenase [NAD(P)+] n=1 Tax=Oceanotoga teriensis TaxID=515440 RepID=A0AA45C5E2_9BACT|nr:MULTISPECIES: NAD(P)H-dependent glycerol-3-phosphate dehydrogenase [Oceanotoga]MDN5342293.1 glycerol-3-phosphate dehydrogenase [Oceanotoga sp.]PWJ88746.1 glycerol 3-phosphate dehydrogenase (NAD(P)+) [Oceanotoga teriensis]
MKIAVIGAGSWGTAMARLLSINGHEISIWNREKEVLQYINNGQNPYYLPGINIPRNIKTFSEINKCIKQSEIIVIAIPSQAVREVLENIKQNYNNQIIVNLSKGIEIKTGKRISEIVYEILNTNKYVCLSGPSHAEEVAKDVPTGIVAASKDLKIAEIVQQNFSNISLRIYTNIDVKGVEISGALKNVYAIAAGVIDGIGGWDNTKAALITRAMVEMKRYMSLNNAKEDTIYGLAGIGDLMVTCNSLHSRNRHVGELIGKGKNLKSILSSMHMVAEGIYTIQALNLIIENNKLDMPIASKIYDVLYNNTDPKLAINELMNRELKSE